MMRRIRMPSSRELRFIDGMRRVRLVAMLSLLTLSLIVSASPVRDCKPGNIALLHKVYLDLESLANQMSGAPDVRCPAAAESKPSDVIDRDENNPNDGATDDEGKIVPNKEESPSPKIKFRCRWWNCKLT